MPMITIPAAPATLQATILLTSGIRAPITIIPLTIVSVASAIVLLNIRKDVRHFVTLLSALTCCFASFLISRINDLSFKWS